MAVEAKTSAKFPAAVVLISFSAGGAITGLWMAALALLMVRRGLSQSAVWPLATVAVGAGSLFSGWLMAFLQRSRGLLCGLTQGLLFVFLLFAFAVLIDSPLQELQFLRFGVVLLLGCTGGFFGVRRAERRRKLAHC